MIPPRIRILPGRVAWREVDVCSWVAEPDGWPTRHAAEGAPRAA